MPTYQRKPVEVEAMPYTRATCRDVCAWLDMEHPDGTAACGYGLRVDQAQTAKPGDWIVRDATGAVSVVSAADFAAQYEPTPRGA